MSVLHECTPLPWYCTLDKPKSWTLELLSLDEYCRFDISAFFLGIKRGSSKASSKAKSSNVREDGWTVKYARPRQARNAWRKNTKIGGNPRVSVAWAICIHFAAIKYTVNLATLPGTWYSRSYLGVLNLVMMTHDLCVLLVHVLHVLVWY